MLFVLALVYMFFCIVANALWKNEINSISPIYFWASFVILNILDAHSTFCFLKKGYKEGNPFMRFSIEKLGTLPGLTIPKIICIPLAIWFFKDNISFLGFNLLLIIIVFFNYKLVLKPPV